ncbi:MAG: PIN domain nuclease [Thermoprotei archaeon]|nr:MAG: PIN domain nuclease [Thermoprotei archaeon]
MTIVYLDSSAIVKRYILEPGSEIVSEVYYKALSGDLTISFSAWNIGEVLGVLDKYHRRGWLGREDYEKARYQFIGETVRLLKIIPVKTKLLIQTWSLIEKHHIYEADALQIVSAKYVKASKLYTGDKQVQEVAAKEGISSAYVG